MRSRRKRYKKLTAIRIRPFIRHTDYTARIVSQRGANLVFEELVWRVVDGGRRLGFRV
jgi:hypothetical protein